MNPPSSWAFFRTSSNEDPAGTEMECLYGGQTLGTFSITWMTSGSWLCEGVSVACSNVTVPGREKGAAGVRGGSLGVSPFFPQRYCDSPSGLPPVPWCHITQYHHHLHSQNLAGILALPVTSVPISPAAQGQVLTSFPTSSSSSPIYLPHSTPEGFLEYTFAHITPPCPLKIPSPLHSLPATPAHSLTHHSLARLSPQISVSIPLCLCACCLLSALSSFSLLHWQIPLTKPSTSPRGGPDSSC